MSLFKRNNQDEEVYEAVLEAVDEDTCRSLENVMENAYRKGAIHYTVISMVIFGIAFVLYGTLPYFNGDRIKNNKAQTIYNTIKEYYVDEVDEDELYEGIYSGMVNYTTDRYSYYIPAESYDDFVQTTSGEYAGIGIVVSTGDERNIDIKYVLEGSPAEEAGIMDGDILTAVEGVEASVDNYYDIVDMVAGEPGTPVNITIYRPSQALTLDKTVERAEITSITVASTVLEDDIGYLRINEFDAVTYEQFKTALEGLKNSNVKGIVMDVRDNPGGLLNIIIQVLDELLDEGVITYTENKYGEKEYIMSNSGGIDIPVVVLANGNSASAAELFTAALKDRGVAKVVGETTFGKGIMQTTIPFSDGSAVKLTTAKYYTPAGVCIQDIGVAPDYEEKALPDFEMPYMSKSEAEIGDNDVQLDKAVEVMREMIG